MPGHKKDDMYRFHLQFNTNDPDQEFAANILSTIGRKKSAFVSTAIRFYMDHSSELPMGRVKKLLIVDENDLRDMIKKELRENVPVVEGGAEAIQNSKPEPPSQLTSPNNGIRQSNNINNKKEEAAPEPSSEDIDFMLAGLDQFM